MSDILCGENIAGDVRAALDKSKFTVTDSNVAALYPELTAGAYVIPAGEKSKTPAILLSILEEMHVRRVQRGDTVCAVGGGVVGDITGFAAAVYMRGVKWINVPTTLLAMVDSSIGGKTAVDLCGVKNLVGAFHMPETVVISAAFLDTLPEREWLCGTGELIKTCLLSEDGYARLISRLAGFKAKEPDDVYSLIKVCVDIKNSVVTSDPKEGGLRKILNVGHTVGHALESLDGYRLSHGEYVLKGMMSELAMCKDTVNKAFYAEVQTILREFSAPPRATAGAVCEAALSDKKNTGDTITLMIPTAPGKIEEVRLSEDEFRSRYTEAQRELKGL